MSPFVFGKLAGGIDFADREKETRHLVQNFSSLINTILISPRRWGKSSLVVKSAMLAAKKDKKLRFCFIDMFNVRREEDFLKIFAEEIIKSTSTKWEDWVRNTKEFFKRAIPKVNFSPDQNSEFSLGFDWEEIRKRPDEILNLAERIAVSKKIKLVLCIDEFQNIGFFSESTAFQKQLRSNWQKHQHVSYCLYGSKRTMMMNVFASPDMPFYKFGDILFIEKIKTPDWIEFIQKRFNDTGKKINEKIAAEIVETCACHPYYVQQLAQMTWLRSGKICSMSDYEEARTALIQQLDYLFTTITENLATTQVNFLEAVIDKVKQFSAKEILKQYELGTSANVLRIKDALIAKELLDSKGGEFYLLDPIYHIWLNNVYFKKDKQL